MAITDSWAAYTPSYRAEQMQQLADWMLAGASGSVVGLVGCGRSNLLRYLCEYPGALQRYLPDPTLAVALVEVDLHDLPSSELVDLYRTILHAFYWVRERFPPSLAEATTTIYLSYRATTDAFLVQKALYDLILAFQHSHMRVVLVMNRFDRFCETISTPAMVNTLRSLRDRFKGTLSYIVGMRQAVAYMPNPALLGDMYELFDNRVCYVGAFNRADAQHMLTGLLRTSRQAPTDAETEMLLQLSGGFASLIRAVGELWSLGALDNTPLIEWITLLIENPAIQYRLERLWQGLTQEEQLVLREIHKLQLQVPANPRTRSMVGTRPLDPQFQPIAQRLAIKGCCIARDTSNRRWIVGGTLLDAYIERHIGGARGRIHLDTTLGQIYQGYQLIEHLTPLEFSILRFLIQNPYTRHTSETIIEKAWPEDDKNKAYITANNLQVHISSIRKKIEPNPSDPRYLVTWTGRPGGYQFFPEGKPE